MIPAAFSNPGRFYRGNTHGHTNASDGALPLEEVISRYKAAGYDFLAITDHFMAQFDYPLTDSRACRSDGFTTLLGAELHAPRTQMSDLWHLVAVGLPLDFAPNTADETGVSLARRAFEAGAFVTIAHPAWYQLSLEDAETVLPWCHGVEIYNHGCQTMHDRGDGAYLLDGLADRGHKTLTLACDDSHFHAPDFGGGWVEVKAEENSPEALLAALKSGAYYSSQGPKIHHIEFTADEIIVECSPARGVLVNGQGYQQAYCYESGLSRVRLPKAKLGSTPWCRIIVIGEDGKRAWSNPIWGETA